ncbi:arginyl-tRNA--protein transferase [Candidatus Nitromaritima sp. SCGC AAA799-A02]|nr:arginyl-tRNA--protein transferase [Candidatus Nitromaritima sp. SCGC AAA799-A02]
MLAHFIDSKSFQCGYFKDRSSLFEEYLLEDISEIEFEYLLAHGMRHFGDYFFRPRCLDCYQCIPIRVRVDDFQITRSQKRALKACDGLAVKIGSPRYADEKFNLYIKHKERFHSLQDDVEDEQNFRLSFYVNTAFGIEFEYYLEDKLVGVALGDHTKNAFSAIYTFYDPSDSKLSLGTFSVLKQLEFCGEQGVKFFYLGYYIEENQSLKYKAGFRPNEVYIDHSWRPFRNAGGDYLIPKNNLLWRNADFLVKPSADRNEELVEAPLAKENPFL